ncbi:MAG TPA: peroxiredoxin [Thermoanaerobaculia bacterium]|nr:peroxiredoxin [Thermoanaerobaculia bacterium]
MKIPFGSLIVTAAVLALAAPLSAGAFPEVGKAAPSFTLMSDEGKEASLADFRGKWVVLYFYPKDFTGGCTLQAKNFQRDLAKYGERNAMVVGVSVDSAESHKEFCEKEGLRFTLLSDPEAKVSERYGSLMEYQGAKLSARNTFLIDPEGKLVRIFEKVKPSGHSEEVLTILAELQNR